MSFSVRPARWQNKPGSMSFIDRGCMLFTLPATDVDAIMTAVTFDALAVGAMTLVANSNVVPRTSIQWTYTDADGSAAGDIVWDVLGINHLGERITERVTHTLTTGTQTLSGFAAWKRIISITLVSKPAAATSASDSVTIGYSWAGAAGSRPRIALPRFGSAVPANMLAMTIVNGTSAVPAYAAVNNSTYNANFSTTATTFSNATGILGIVTWDPDFRE